MYTLEPDTLYTCIYYIIQSWCRPNFRARSFELADHEAQNLSLARQGVKAFPRNVIICRMQLTSVFFIPGPSPVFYFFQLPRPRSTQAFLFVLLFFPRFFSLLSARFVAPLFTTTSCVLSFWFIYSPSRFTGPFYVNIQAEDTPLATSLSVRPVSRCIFPGSAERAEKPNFRGEFSGIFANNSRTTSNCYGNRWICQRLRV